VTAIDLSSDIGLVALYLLTANILLGLLLSVRYNPWTHWPHRRINYFKLHNWTGYLALVISGLHPVVLLFSSTAGFGVIDVLYPVHSPKQPVINTLGGASLYLLAVVVVTSYFRVEIGRRRWKLLHYITYITAALFFVHGVWTDPTLKGAPVDLLDGEKVGLELCALAVIIASAFRVRYALRRRAARANAPRRISSAAA
jgi:predicted ferric reductase